MRRYYDDEFELDHGIEDIEDLEEDYYYDDNDHDDIEEWEHSYGNVAEEIDEDIMD